MPDQTLLWTGGGGCSGGHPGPAGGGGAGVRPARPARRGRAAAAVASVAGGTGAGAGAPGGGGGPGAPDRAVRGGIDRPGRGRDARLAGGAGKSLMRQWLDELASCLGQPTLQPPRPEDIDPTRKDSATPTPPAAP